MTENEKKLQSENDRLRAEVAMLRARRLAPGIYFPASVDHAFFVCGPDGKYYAVVQVVQIGTSTRGSAGVWPIEFNAGQAG